MARAFAAQHGKTLLQRAFAPQFFRVCLFIGAPRVFPCRVQLCEPQSARAKHAEQIGTQGHIARARIQRLRKRRLRQPHSCLRQQMPALADQAFRPVAQGRIQGTDHGLIDGFGLHIIGRSRGRKRLRQGLRHIARALPQTGSARRAQQLDRSGMRVARHRQRRIRIAHQRLQFGRPVRIVQRVHALRADQRLLHQSLPCC